MRLGIVVISDRGYEGKRKDKSGILIKEMLKKQFNIVKSYYSIIPDEEKLISQKIIELTDKMCCHLILTTGGTGLSERDCTPEATSKVIDRIVPGISEIMRIISFKHSPRAMLSRAISGVRKRTLIINLPGSAKAVKECLEVIMPTLNHALEVLQGESIDCG